MICKQCGDEVHYCGNCDYVMHKDLGYCSKHCLESSKPYLEATKNFSSFLRTLTPDQKVRFANFLEAYPDYEIILDNMWELFINHSDSN